MGDIAKQVKNKLLGARVDHTMHAKVKSYTDRAGVDMGEVVRAAVIEYMINHPIQEDKSKSVPTKLTIPGE